MTYWIGVCESEYEVFQEIGVSVYRGVGERFGIVPITRHKGYWAGGVASAEIGPKNPADDQHEPPGTRRMTSLRCFHRPLDVPETKFVDSNSAPMQEEENQPAS